MIRSAHLIHRKTEREMTARRTTGIVTAAALGLTVNILEVWSSNGGSSRASASVRTLISFISEDGGKVVPSEDVTQ
ncbi:hypothetical protein F7725_006049 [Dissostichus mawsoni]|uniref:Uncharacterized protein n=1 Tax=Dissostichus mawsoni TaxID=36200 RepID=A0A7J5YSX6_DISMA|nr:hypothetical protein F7725_006049 [Dissostichus mawsoni]